jgi:hypothetical protein
MRILLIPRSVGIQAQPKVEGNGERAATNQAGPSAGNRQISKSGHLSPERMSSTQRRNESR